MSTRWINYKKPIWKSDQITKPCHACGYCPFGSIVELFPLHEPGHEDMSCGAFGHDCPAYYNAEMIVEEIAKGDH